MIMQESFGWQDVPNSLVNMSSGVEISLFSLE